MSIATTFGVGTQRVLVPVEDGETLTLYPTGGTLYYGDKNVTVATFSGTVASGGSFVPTDDVWLVAATNIRVQAVSVKAGTGGGATFNAAVFGERKYVVPTFDGVAGDGTTNDAATIQTILDGVTRGHVVLTKGTYRLTSELVINQYTDANDHLTIEFEDGAILKRTNAASTDPVLRVLRDDTVIRHPQVEGSGSKGNGTGIKLGPEDTDLVNDVPYRVKIYDPIIKNCDTGIEVGIVLMTGNPNKGHSSGDVGIYGGYISSVKNGIKNRGFTTRCYDLTINGCEKGYWGTGTRNPQRADLFGLTINNWTDAAAVVEGGDGTTFYNAWFERPNGLTTAPQIIRVGSAVSAGDAQDYQAQNVKFMGTTTLLCSNGFPEPAVILLRNARGFYMQHLSLSTDGGVPNFLVKCEATHTGTGNRIQKASLWPGNNNKNQFQADPNPSPGYPAPVQNLGTGDIYIDRVPAAEGTARGLTVLRDHPGQFQTATAAPGTLPPGTTYFRSGALPQLIVEPLT